MTDLAARLRAAIRQPLPLAYHPLYRFYEGGSLTRTFRGLPGRPDDWWSEDWVGSCTLAGNADPDGRRQGLSLIDLPGAGPIALREIIGAWPAEMVGARFAERWGPITGVLVKLLSPAGQVPLHAHPTRAWARRHLGSPFGKTEAWILLDTPGDGTSSLPLRRDRLPAGRHPGVVRRRGAPARRPGHPRLAAPDRRPSRRGVRGARRSAAVPRAAALVHRGAGAE